MNKQTLTWMLAIAVPVGVVALATAYVYRDTGQLPFQRADIPPAASVAGSSASGSQGAQQSAAADIESQAGADGVPQQTAQSDLDVIKPSFDVVGVEPTGETVVAGRSGAGAIVALTANGRVVGKSIANQAGEWTIILDEPLQPGDYDVGLEVHDQNGAATGRSDERLAVSVPQGANEQPLIVMNTPDGPSEVLQMPTPAAPAAVAETPGPETVQEADAAATVELAAEEPASPPAQALETAEAPAVSDPAVQETVVAGLEDNNAPVPPATDQPAAEMDAGPALVTAGIDDADAPSVTVEAVESEPDKVFVAGTGEPGSSVRVYVGEDFQGEAQVDAGGKWLVEGDGNVSQGNVEVRADQIAQDGDTVAARAAVTFVKQEEQQIVLTKAVATGASGGAQGKDASLRKALPVVIIRKGDNLWRISRRLYGDGFRYTTIYQANQDQIRDPDLIYPGQVFLTPEGDLEWPRPDSASDRNG